MKLFSFVAGAGLGTAGALFNFWIQSSPIHWPTVGCCAGVLGLLAIWFGEKFWNLIFSIWP